MTRSAGVACITGSPIRTLPRERAILAAKAPEVPEKLAGQVVAFLQKLRGEDLFKLPGVAETIDWAQALTYLNKTELTAGDVDETLGVLLKYQDDIAKVKRGGGGADPERSRRRVGDAGSARREDRLVWASRSACSGIVWAMHGRMISARRREAHEGLHWKLCIASYFAINPFVCSAPSW